MKVEQEEKNPIKQIQNPSKIFSLKGVLTGLSSIDLYITYKCNLRCNHCFIGEDLNLNTNFNYELLINLIEECSNAGLDEITFLGGEPTLYPNFDAILSKVYSYGLEARIVTNGGVGFTKLISKKFNHPLPHVCFSIDGASDKCHDSMRGKNSLKTLMSNANKYKELGGPISVITSIDKSNYQEVKEIIQLSEDIGSIYMNIHYVNNRGFAKDENILSVDEWDHVVNEIMEQSKSTSLPIRFEKTFKNQYDNHSICFVKTKSHLMFFPDQKVYRCAMFLDVPNSHSYLYTKDGMILNESKNSETKICSSGDLSGCPATNYAYQPVLDTLDKSNRRVDCVYNKTCVSNGEIISDIRSH